MAYESVGMALRRCREEAGLTLRDVSRASGVSINQISQVETGRRLDPAFSTVARIAIGLKLSLDAVAKFAGYAEAGPALESRLSATERKRLATMRELHDVTETVGTSYERLRKAVDTLSDVRTAPPRSRKA